MRALLLTRRARARRESLPPAAIVGCATLGCMNMPRQPACLYGARSMPPRQACQDVNNEVAKSEGIHKLRTVTVATVNLKSNLEEQNMFGQLIGDLIQGTIGGVMGGFGEGAGRLISGFKDGLKGKEEEGECEEGCQGECGGDMGGGFGASASGSTQAMRGLGTSLNISL